jgi:hypothetical protein
MALDDTDQPFVGSRPMQHSFVFCVQPLAFGTRLVATGARRLIQGRWDSHSPKFTAVSRESERFN